MDTPTQMLLGAAVGHVCFGHKLGRRAAWWGAVAGTIPDLDVLVVPFTGRIGEFAFHRGPTHSLVFGPLVGPILGYVVWRWYARRKKADTEPDDRSFLPAWIGLFVLALFTHPLLDIFTTYGTVLYWPFSDTRVALNAVAITDPAYSGLLIAALLIGSRYRARPAVGRWACAAALILSTMYLFYGLSIHHRTEALAREQLLDAEIAGQSVTAYPTILQPYLRRVIARSEDEIRVGFISMWNPHKIEWRAFTQDAHPFVRRLMDTRDGRVFTWFAMDQIVSKVFDEGGEVVVELDDMRYGFPDSPETGIWGIRGRFDANGNMIGPVEYFNRPYPASVGNLLATLLAATFAPESD